jgi:predicted nucleotidyltransferase component of viral defense system
MSPGQKVGVLEKAIAKLLRSAILPDDCYLAGGTALYFYLHHRLSVDLDFFSPRPFHPELLVFRFREEFGIESGIMASFASLDDIEAMKSLALVQRGSAKDFVDLFYLLKKTGHSFGELSLLGRRKYDVGEKYDYHLKTAMVYFDDAEKELAAIMIVDESGGIRSISEIEWKEIKGFFERLCL